MTLGIGTYATFWEWSSRNPNPISLAGMIERTHDLGCEVFQICDYPQIEKMDTVQLEEAKALADELGIELELGTRGTDVNHLTKYLDIANILGTRTLRSMVQVGDGKPSLEQSIQNVKDLLPRLHEQEVRLAFETYEQLPTSKLVDFVKQIDDSAVGIALDPANCVAGLEHPNDVIRRCAPYTINLHVKDFAFSRRAGWVGFTYAGAKMGEGLLDFALKYGTPEEMWLGYEPYWAIGAAEPASSEYVSEVCRNIREGLPELSSVTILYGGSAGPGLITKLDSTIDGLFLGRFAHDPKAFLEVAKETLARS